MPRDLEAARISIHFCEAFQPADLLYVTVVAEGEHLGAQKYLKFIVFTRAENPPHAQREYQGICALVVMALSR